MAFESNLKTRLKDIGQEATLDVHDIKSNLFRCSSPLIKAHKGETYCRHRLILVSTATEGFLSGLETYEYVLSGNDKEKEERRIVYISKVDTTRTLSKFRGLTARVVQAYIASLPPSSSVFVFARAQPQYLFAKSAENKAKSVLSDRELVSWWLSVLNKTPAACEGWWSVPGVDDLSSALIEIGARKRGWTPSEKVQWHYGTSYPQEAEASLVIPRFDDDAKSRLLKSVEEDEKLSVADFWNLLAFGEECGSGKVTGFFELRIKEQPLTVEKLTAKSDMKNKDFTVFWNQFMSLDFHDDESNLESTKTALKDVSELFPSLQPISIKVDGMAEEVNKNGSDKRPAVNMLSGGFIKRKKV